MKLIDNNIFKTLFLDDKQLKLKTTKGSYFIAMPNDMVGFWTKTSLVKEQALSKKGTKYNSVSIKKDWTYTLIPFNYDDKGSVVTNSNNSKEISGIQLINLYFEMKKNNA